MSEFTLPDAVKRQSEEAQRMIGERTQRNTPPAEPAEPDEPPKEPQPTQDPEPKEEEESPKEGDEALKERLQAMEQDVSYWRNRFNTLQGKYNAEVPRLNQKVQELQQSLDKGAQPQSSEPGEIFSQEEIEELGPDAAKILATAVDRRVNQLVEQRVGPMEQEHRSERERQAVTAEERFFEDLASQAPDWARVNEDPTFDQWLYANTDRRTGLTFKQLLGEARQNLNAAAAASFFNDFQTEQGKAAQTTEPPPEPNPQRPSRESQVQPDNSRGTPPPTDQAQGKIWTGEEINEFYRRVREGHFRGKDEDKVATEKDIYAAYREGRVRG